MKRNILKGITFIAVFFLSLVVISRIMNQGNTDMTAEMPEAALPVVSIEFNHHLINSMYGYTDERAEAFMRDSLTPVGSDRRVAFVIDTYGEEIGTVSYEVRSMDGERLIEGGPIETEEAGEDRKRCVVQLKDLIEGGVEYSFAIILNMAYGTDCYYYTRIIQNEDYYEKEKLEFVTWFHDITMGRGDGEEIKKYMESNAEGDNSTFHKVNIHSSLRQVMWDELEVERVAEPEIYLKELTAQTASFLLKYMVREGQGKQAENYFVEEYYRVRYTPDRMYLLDYERTMDQIFKAEAASINMDKITLGIGSTEFTMEESEGGKILSFVNGNRLFVYNTVDNKLAQVFSFYDANHFDNRTTNRNSLIRILEVEDSGNIMFLVGGYMNRGLHEGKTGIGIYYYNSVVNTIEEQVFLPYGKSEDILQKDLEKMAYLNKNGHVYFQLESSLYDVNLTEKSHEVVVSGMAEDGFQISGSGSMIVWQKENDKYASRMLRWMNLNSGRIMEITGKATDYILPMGFIGEDLIYGLARQEDVIRDYAGTVLFPVYRVVIQSETGDILKVYQKENCYVTDSVIADNQITLKRVAKTEEGDFVPLPDDQITSSEEVDATTNTIVTVPINVYKTIVQIKMKTQPDIRSLKVMTPKEVLYEGGREIQLEEALPTECYYVYGPYGIDTVTAEAARAIEIAYEISGSVVDAEGNYIWKKGTKFIRNQIMAIEGQKRSEEESSLAVCLDTILQFEGISRKTQGLLEQKEGAVTILEDSLRHATILDLTGCTLDTVLYYIDQDIPVLAMMEEDAMLITGFNEQQIVLMDPETGTLYKRGIADARQMFAETGNRFLTYVRTEEY